MDQMAMEFHYLKNIKPQTDVKLYYAGPNSKVDCSAVADSKYTDKTIQVSTGKYFCVKTDTNLYKVHWLYAAAGDFRFEWNVAKELT
jgi:hypothetical protein